MHNKILIFAIILVIGSSCSSNDDTSALQVIEKSIYSDYQSRLSSIKYLHKEDFAIRPSLYKTITSFDSTVRSTRKSIDQVNISDIPSILNNYYSYCNTIKDSAQNLNSQKFAIPKSNSPLYAKIQVNMLAYELIRTLAADIGSEDIRFDELRTIVDLDKPTVKLGESITGTMYLAATSSLKNQKTVFLLNGDTIETDNYKAEFSLKPQSRGTEKLIFQIKSNGKFWLSETDFYEKVIEIEVK
jgi:hypothetical protein